VRAMGGSFGEFFCTALCFRDFISDNFCKAASFRIFLQVFVM
jgi:hypothetical protein